jgi:hypothetical protein
MPPAIRIRVKSLHGTLREQDQGRSAEFKCCVPAVQIQPPPGRGGGLAFA